MSTPHNTPRTIALVLTYNNGPEAIRCIESLRSSSLGKLAVRVVDNASDDGCAERLAAHFDGLDLTRSPRNRGFGGGCNIGMRRAIEEGAEYVVLVNPDASVAPDTLQKLVQFADEHPRAGAVGPKTFSMDPMPDGRPRLLYAGAFASALPLRQRVPGIEHADEGGPAQPLEVDYVWGHGVLLRVAALKEIGCFDERFFMYCEDLDLCVRLKNAGYSLWCEPSAHMWHDAPDGARAIHSEPWRWRCKAHGMGVFHCKHHGPLKGRGLSIATAALESLQLLRQGKWRALGHQLRAQIAHGFGLGFRPPADDSPPVGRATR